MEKGPLISPMIRFVLSFSRKALAPEGITAVPLKGWLPTECSTTVAISALSPEGYRTNALPRKSNGTDGPRGRLSRTHMPGGDAVVVSNDQV
jgi:hypothetical protein